MPRVAKPKAGAANLPATKKKPAAKKINNHLVPEPVSEGEIITDVSKTQWKIGPSIGKGGFGQIYSACKASGPSVYDYVVKIEPHNNGTLFVEMHFYMRNAKQEDIKQFQRSHNLKSLGMPYLVGSGSHFINNIKHRFLVMPRYGSDISKMFTEPGRKLPEHTIYRLALQMLDVYEYIHGRMYVHADLKGENILLGYGRGGAAQAYLVDFGLASHYTQKEFKPDPKKMHNGTIEFTSRDAHLGVATMRGDLEILGYNIIDWSGGILPWEKENLLKVPVKVQKSKEAFMDDVSGSLKKLYLKGVPNPILVYMKYVATLKYDDTPDYEKCRKIFLDGLKTLKVPHSGDLEFKLKSTPNLKGKFVKTPTAPSSDESVNESDSDDAFDKPSPAKKSKPIQSKFISPARRKALHADSPTIQTPVKSESPSRKRKASPVRSKRASPASKSTPVTAKINFSPVVSIRKNTPSSSRKPGKTIINDNLTPKPKSSKTYEFNFELDVSMDANVVVNIKRKKKAEEETTTIESPSLNGSYDSPRTRVRIRKMKMDSSRSDKKAFANSPRSKNLK